MASGDGSTPPARRRQQGLAAEQQARRYLESRGLVLVESNYRCRGGEIDLVMRDGDCLVFVEVRQRRSARYGSGAESVTWHKQQKLIHAAQHYLLARRALDRAARFDVVSLTGQGKQAAIHWIRDAFGA